MRLVQIMATKIKKLKYLPLKIVQNLYFDSFEKICVYLLLVSFFLSLTISHEPIRFTCALKYVHMLSNQTLNDHFLVENGDESTRNRCYYGFFVQQAYNYGAKSNNKSLKIRQYNHYNITKRALQRLDFLFITKYYNPYLILGFQYDH